jgi:hypothetical protein
MEDIEREALLSSMGDLLKSYTSRISLLQRSTAEENEREKA